LYAGADIPFSDIDKINFLIAEFLDSVHFTREEGSYFPCVASYDHLNKEIRELLIEHEFSRNIARSISKNLKPSKPESRSMYEAQKAGKDVKKLPLSLGEALDRLAEDEVIKSAMPDEMYKVFHWYKNDEWEKFLGATTQWDLDTYLDCLP